MICYQTLYCYKLIDYEYEHECEREDDCIINITGKTINFNYFYKYTKRYNDKLRR
jgi:hypothetical protein